MTLTHSTIASKTNIITSETHEDGIYYKVRVPDFIFNALGVNQFIIGPENPKYQKSY